jgi:cytochrome P450
MNWQNLSFGFIPYGPWWRRHRRAFHGHFRADAVHKYQPILTKETHAFLRRLLVTPENFLHHVRQ